MKNFIFSTTTIAAFCGTSCAAPAAVTHDDVGGLPREEQHTAFATAAPAEQAAIYRGHLLHIAESLELTPAQQDALARAAALVTPDWYALEDLAPDDTARVKAAQQESERLVTEALGKDAARAMVMIAPEQVQPLG